MYFLSACLEMVVRIMWLDGKVYNGDDGGGGGDNDDDDDDLK